MNFDIDLIYYSLFQSMYIAHMYRVQTLCVQMNGITFNIGICLEVELGKYPEQKISFATFNGYVIW